MDGVALRRILVLLLLASPSLSQKKELTPPLRKHLELPSILTGSPEREHGDSLLTMNQGGNDELPEGPDAFAIFSDGRIAVNDPLRRRVLIYSSEGQFRSSLSTRCRADAVDVDSQGRLQVRDSTSNLWYLPSPKENQLVGHENDDPQTGDVTLSADRRQAVVRITQYGEAKTFSITDLPQPLASIQLIAHDTSLTVVLAIEVVGPGDGLKVITRVRRYGTNGAVLSEILDVPNDYYIFPTRAFRVNNSLLYQLEPRKSGVEINVWSLSEEH